MAVVGNLVEIAGVMLAQATHRVELSGQNLSNLATPGYKSKLSFADLMGSVAVAPGMRVAADLAQGALTSSGVSTDLALSGAGFFSVATPDGIRFTRQGQFTRDSDGRLVTAQGFPLQTREGGDLVVAPGDFEVTSVGVVIQEGEARGRIAIASADDPAAIALAADGLFAISETERVTIETPSVRQAMLEASNVSSAQEMTAMMQALRQAETAQRLVNVYDDLMGRAITTFGQG